MFNAHIKEFSDVNLASVLICSFFFVKETSHQTPVATIAILAHVVETIQMAHVVETIQINIVWIKIVMRRLLLLLIRNSSLDVPELHITAIVSLVL